MITAFYYTSCHGIIMGTITLPVATTLAIPTLEEMAAIAKWHEKDERARGLIIMHLESNYKSIVLNQTTLENMWDALILAYDRVGPVGAFVLWQQLYGMKYDDSKSLMPQIQGTLDLVNRVTNAGITLGDQLSTMLIIAALPTSYDTIASTILTTTADISRMKPADVLPKIQEEESRRKSNAQLNKVSHTTPLQTSCGKCGKTNHTTAQHWPDGKHPKNNNQGENRN